MADFFERARELEKEEGRLHEALVYYDMAIEDKSGPYDIRSHQGRVLNRLREYEEAMDCFDYVLDTLEVNHFDSIFGKGIVFLGLNKWDDALKCFYKCKELNNRNANVWYYLSLLLKEKGCKEEYKIAYKNFSKLDNKIFRKSRSFYDFGIAFKEKEIELINELGEDFEKTDKYYNIELYINFLKKIGFNDKEVSYYLNVAPLDELKKKVELRIIKNELIKQGLDKEKIDDLIRDYKIEDLKSVIISNTQINPFNQMDIFDSQNLFNMFKSMPMNHAYEYKFHNIDIFIENEDGETQLNKFDIFFEFYDRNIERETINENFKHLSEKIYLNDIVEVKNLFDKIESFNIKEFSDLKKKLDYFKVLIEYYCKNNLQYEEIYKPLDEISQFLDVSSNPDYISIKSSILYDLERYEELINYLNSKDFTKDTHLNYDFIYYLLSSAYYRLGDYVNSYNVYNKISSKNLNSNTLNHLYEKQNI